MTDPPNTTGSPSLPDSMIQDIKPGLEWMLQEFQESLWTKIENRLDEIQEQLGKSAEAQEMLETIHDQLSKLRAAQEEQKEYLEIPPLPKVDVSSRSKKQFTVERDRITGTVDPVLFDLFHKERKARGVNVSRMLDIVLWKYFGKPKLSFELIAEEVPFGETNSDSAESPEGKGGA